MMFVVAIMLLIMVIFPQDDHVTSKSRPLSFVVLSPNEACLFRTITSRRSNQRHRQARETGSSSFLHQALICLVTCYLVISFFPLIRVSCIHDLSRLSLFFVFCYCCWNCVLQYTITVSLLCVSFFCILPLLNNPIDLLSAFLEPVRSPGSGELID